ncbi:hypothetical protein ABIB57_004438 [Devosia sp. UYZn731]|uniref:hypothetical protein n=1 Tax=Devosia sp. UYZn731 TaxID=3156345 RepID=UPI0033922A7C
MRRLSDPEPDPDIHILSVVAKHDCTCIAVPVDAEWAPIPEALRRLAKWKYLVEEQTDDGPAYSPTAAGYARCRAAT